jgi:hypothetical protein
MNWHQVFIWGCGLVGITVVMIVILAIVGDKADMDDDDY